MRLVFLSLALASAAVPVAAQDTLGTHIDAVTARARGAWQSATDRARAEADQVAQRASKTAGEVADAARRRAGDAQHAAAEKAKQASEHGSSLTEQVGALALEQVAKVGDVMSALVDRGKAAAASALTAARSEARDLLIDAAAVLDRQNAEAKREARAKHWDALKARFALDGTRPSAELSEELRDHAYRVARLTRVRALAEAADDDDSVARADRLLEAEQGRHHRRVHALRSEQRAVDGDDP